MGATHNSPNFGSEQVVGARMIMIVLPNSGSAFLGAGKNLFGRIYRRRLTSEMSGNLAKAEAWRSQTKT